jgi:hypothetical protein
MDCYVMARRAPGDSNTTLTRIIDALLLYKFLILTRRARMLNKFIDCHGLWLYL